MNRFWEAYQLNSLPRVVALVVGLLLSLCGCGGAPVKGYLRPGITVSHIRSLAILPFDNISGHPDAGKKGVNMLLTELTRTGLFEIATTGEVEKSLRRLRIRTTAEVDLSKLVELGVHLRVQVVIAGSVDEYEIRQDKGRSVPVVAISARILEVQTGDILWAISHTRDGNDWETVFGFGRIISLGKLTQIVISEMVESLMRALKASATTEGEGE